jgi:crotonobetainyl-CoA:carnitine CoA-transferase CaiB-like acyl-CoA transferase
MSLPTSLLEGVTVLDLAGRNAQLAGRLAAELGAEVILVEPPQGDPSRHVGPWAGSARDVEASLAFAALNSGKRSVVLDPADPAASAMVEDLASHADVILTSDTGPWASVLGVDALAATGRPVVAVYGFAADGPYATYLAPEVVTTALGGLLFISGEADRAPTLPPESLGQYFASVWAALALVTAVWAARMKSINAVYRISTHEALATQEHLIRAAAMDHEPIVRNGSQHKNVAPARVFPTRDGFAYIYVSRNHWPAFLGAWQPHPAEFDDRRWLPNSVRRAHSKELNDAVTAWTVTFETRELVPLLQEAGVPCLAVNRPSDFVNDEQVVARELFTPAEHHRFGAYRQIRFPAMIDGQRPPATEAPSLGQDTERYRSAIAARGNRA